MTAPADRLSTPPGAQPFSRPLVADDVPDDGLERTIDADPSECRAVARDVEIPAVLDLKAHYTITRRPGGRIRIEGEVEAKVTQTCVVSLEPFDSSLVQPVDITFAPAPTQDDDRRVPSVSRRREPARKRETPAPVRVTEREDDPPDPIIDGRIDLGAVAVEFLTLSLDFYPRKPGVQFSDVVVEAGEEKPSAFAALARLRDNS